MKLTRRDALIAGAGAFAVFGLGLGPARAAVDDANAGAPGWRAREPCSVRWAMYSSV